MTDNRTTELLPCPFCGGEVCETSPEEYNDKYWRIMCASCGARMGGTHRGMNREAWNTRACGQCEGGAVPMTEENMAEHMTSCAS